MTLPLCHIVIYIFANLIKRFSTYVEEENLYQIIINKDKIRYPFQDSRDRRLNFTIAHELGHILLDHLSIPDILKINEERELEDLEANEFAGKLLIPEKTLLHCNFVSIPAVAEFFNVSNTALWIRLNNLQRLDLLESKITRVCSKYGNTQFHGAARYCRICGNHLKNNMNGVERKTYYETVSFDNCFEQAECPYCGQKHFYWPEGICPSCDRRLYNYCHKGLYLDIGGCSHTNPDYARFCEICGSETYFSSMGFLRPWNDAHNIIPESVVAEEKLGYMY
ncbi:ImmA/IrrE family metallo-endopeptidase [Clostridium sp. BNL1100]|uniref:ImmA/IrrE family metallo-endopeptidase n=1 Tax=Clostridium sp. BNL1100 TaxID=755731 RepID=UPI00024A7D25|nr:ImmA/IrrE family metallo-endopeptidase [Clostridium sp. BNL1100]AEY67518.1 putative Zn peptidase [Clostridium sp. BNL1100]